MKIHSFLSLFTQDVQKLPLHSEIGSQQTLCEYLVPHVDTAVSPKQMASPLSLDKELFQRPCTHRHDSACGPPTLSSPGVMVGVVYGDKTWRATHAAINQFSSVAQSDSL